MRHPFVRTALLVVVALIASAAARPAKRPWTDRPVPATGDDFSFAVVADRTCCNRPGVFPEAVAKLNLMRPPFIMSVGDFIDGYTEDVVELNRQWDEFLGEVAKLEPRIYLVPGNHDQTNPVGARVWKERFDKSYYAFKHRNVLFLCLSSEDGGYSQMGKAQGDFVIRTLKENRQARWVFVFMHKPLWTGDEGKVPAQWTRIEDALKGRKHTVFVGHTHTYTAYERHGRDYILMAVTGGGLESDKREFGDFDHIMWVSMTKEGPILANLMLDGIRDKNVVTPALRGFPATVAKATPVQMTPQVTTEKSLGRVEMKFAAKNETAGPMRVRVEAGSAGPFTGTGGPAEVVVEAGKSGELGIVFTSSRPVAVEGFTPLPYSWTVSATPAGHREVSVGGKGTIMVDRPRPVARRAKPVVVDGKLDEWGDLANACEREPEDRDGRWKGPADSSYRFAVSYDDEFIYVAVRVRDESIVAVDGVDTWNQDGIYVGIEGRGEVDWAPPTRDTYNYVFMSPGPDAAKTIVPGHDWVPKDTRKACVTGPNGWTAEVAIPVASIQKGADKPWKCLRVNVATYDFDADTGDRGTYLYWRPDWKNPDATPGLGAFVRQ